MVDESPRPLECIICGKAAPVLSASGLCPHCFHTFERIADRIVGESWSRHELEHAYEPAAATSAYAH